MELAPNAREKIKVADVVMSSNHVVFLANRFSRLISLPTSAIFVSGTSGIMTILKYRNVNPISYTIQIMIAQSAGAVETQTAPMQRGKTPPMSVLDMTLNNKILSRKYGIFFKFHIFLIIFYFR